MKDRLHTFTQPDAYTSPWPRSVRIGVGLWQLVTAFLFRPTPKPLWRWRNFLLRCFGANIAHNAFVDASAVIKMPWNLTMEERATIGARADIYNLARVTLKARATVAQQVYLCGGSHEFSLASLPLIIGDITIGADAFVGARAFVMPGVVVGDGAVVGACSVVVRDVPAWTIAAGHPCKPLKPRNFTNAAEPPAQAVAAP